MKIALAGLTGYENYGDCFIFDCCGFLVKKSFPDAEILELNFEKGTDTFLSRLLYRLGKKTGRHSLTYQALKRKHLSQYENIIREADAVIFSCGSFKYGTQLLWAYYSLVIELAEKHHKPVMFDAMNVQKYDGSDERCRILREHLNYPCVRMFTSRDGNAGVRRLKESYLKKKDMTVLPAGDPAFWLKEAYEMEKKDSGTIGINILKGENFRKYGKNLSEEEVMNSYVRLLELLTENGQKWELFTNGLKSDLAFGRRILERLNMTDREIRVPSSARELARMIAGYSCILGGRLHACICAYSLGVPFMGMIWDDKMLFFAEVTQTKDCFLSEEEISGDNLYQKLMRISSFSIDVNTREALKKMTESSIRQFLENEVRNG